MKSTKMSPEGIIHWKNFTFVYPNNNLKEEWERLKPYMEDYLKDK